MKTYLRLNAVKIQKATKELPANAVQGERWARAGVQPGGALAGDVGIVKYWVKSANSRKRIHLTGTCSFGENYTRKDVELYAGVRFVFTGYVWEPGTKDPRENYERLFGGC